MRHKRKPLYKRCNLLPYHRKYRRFRCICQCQPMHPGIPIGVILRLRTNKTIVIIYNLPIPYNHYSNTAHTGALFIGSFKIYGSKVLHNSSNNYLASSAC